MHRLAACVAAALGAALVAAPSGVDATVSRSSGLASKKELAGSSPHDDPPPLLGTLVQLHTDECVPLDAQSPSPERFSALLADRVTGERRALDPQLLELIRSIARTYPGARFELVSGYRSPKLNEMLRKKGRNVASQSQHSLGQAVDFRVVVDRDERGVDPRVLEREIRDLGWRGGIGVYTLDHDWFVHVDVGRLRRWRG